MMGIFKKDKEEVPDVETGMSINNVFDEQSLFNYVLTLFENPLINVEVKSERKRYIHPSEYGETKIPNYREKIFLEIEIGGWESGLRFQDVSESPRILAEWANTHAAYVIEQADKLRKQIG